MGEDSIDIAANLIDVAAQIESALKAAGRDRTACELVAVSKTKPAGLIRQALVAGQKVFGENRVQEAEEKWPALKQEFAGITLHLIGPLQTNKVKNALKVFDVIETLDRPKLANALARERDNGANLPQLYIQVNTGAEPQKAGVLPEEADAFIAQCRDQLNLPIVGLMAIPPVDEEPAMHFALLHKIAKRNGLQKLSMGMSSDYDVAIPFGATSVRVGTAIFGSRQS